MVALSLCEADAQPFENTEFVVTLIAAGPRCPDFATPFFTPGSVPMLLGVLLLSIKSCFPCKRTVGLVLADDPKNAMDEYGTGTTLLPTGVLQTSGPVDAI